MTLKLSSVFAINLDRMDHKYVLIDGKNGTFNFNGTW